MRATRGPVVATARVSGSTSPTSPRRVGHHGVRWRSARHGRDEDELDGQPDDGEDEHPEADEPAQGLRVEGEVPQARVGGPDVPHQPRRRRDGDEPGGHLVHAHRLAAQATDEGGDEHPEGDDEDDEAAPHGEDLLPLDRPEEGGRGDRGRRQGRRGPAARHPEPDQLADEHGEDEDDDGARVGVGGGRAGRGPPTTAARTRARTPSPSTARRRTPSRRRSDGVTRRPPLGSGGSGRTRGRRRRRRAPARGCAAGRGRPRSDRIVPSGVPTSVSRSNSSAMPTTRGTRRSGSSAGCSRTTRCRTMGSREPERNDSPRRRDAPREGYVAESELPSGRAPRTRVVGRVTWPMSWSMPAILTSATTCGRSPRCSAMSVVRSDTRALWPARCGALASTAATRTCRARSRASFSSAYCT